jgi:AcrR family transcriptional regulator
MTSVLAGPATRLERRKARTRASILAAAEELFGSRGYDDTSIAQIAERADTGVGTVYGYFASKADILHAVLVDHSLKANAEYLQTIDDTTPHADRMVAALAAYARYLRENRTLLRAAFSASVISGDHHELNAVRLVSSFEKQFQAGIAAGQLRDLPVRSTVFVLLNTYLMAFLGIGAWASRKDDPAMLDELETIVRATITP